MLVVSIDESMPKGRLKLPEVQTLRDALEEHVLCSVVRDTELAEALQRYPEPDIVIAHSLVVDHVARLLPEQVPMTTTATLFAEETTLGPPSNLWRRGLVERLKARSATSF